jgi:hypothetical protein
LKAELKFNSNAGQNRVNGKAGPKEILSAA